jgi:hypothetical protein
MRRAQRWACAAVDVDTEREGAFWVGQGALEEG